MQRWRFFLVLWGASFLGGILIIAGVELSRRVQSQRLEPFVRHVLRLSVQERTAALTRDGAAELRSTRDEDALHVPLRLAVFDARDRAVATEGVDDLDRGGVGTLARTGVGDRARRSGRLEMETVGDTILAARAVDGPDGEPYLVVAEGPVAVLLVAASPRELFVRSLAVLLLVTVSCVCAARYVNPPMRMAHDASRRLATGDLSVRIPPAFTSRKDDAGRMARAFNHMANRMERTMETQRRMLRDISHELRSPLARLLIAVELARESIAPRTVPSLDRIESDVSRMNRLIGDLLMLGRLDTAHDPALDREIDLKALVLDVVADARAEAAVKPCSLVADSLQELIVVGCEDTLRSAVENVVRNAIKYNARHAVVDVALRPAGKFAELVVSDQGPGVPEGDLERIFEPFYRVDDARGRSTGGTGLGLAIARRAVQVHEGTIGARNNPDGGLAITMRLAARGATGTRAA